MFQRLYKSLWRLSLSFNTTTAYQFILDLYFFTSCYVCPVDLLYLFGAPSQLEGQYRYVLNVLLAILIQRNLQLLKSIIHRCFSQQINENCVSWINQWKNLLYAVFNFLWHYFNMSIMYSHNSFRTGVLRRVLLRLKLRSTLFNPLHY